MLGSYEVGAVVRIGSRQSAGLQRKEEEGRGGEERRGEERREEWGGNKHIQFVNLQTVLCARSLGAPKKVSITRKQNMMWR